MRVKGSVLLYAGVVVAGAGFALLVLTWSLVAPLESVSEQVPYVVSGGMPGLGLIIIGATLINVQSKRRDAEVRHHQLQQLNDVLGRLTALVEGPQAVDAEVDALPRDDDVPQAESVDQTEDLAVAEEAWAAR